MVIAAPLIVVFGLLLSAIPPRSANDLLPPLLSPFGAYPNPLDIDDNDRQLFHPVIVFPTIETEDGTRQPNLVIADFRQAMPGQPQLATEEERRTRASAPNSPRARPVQDRYTIGRYDENRLGMYESDLFSTGEEPRTVHVGMDLGGPLLTPVHAFYSGTIDSCGYNAALGDYGHVIVVRHVLPTKPGRDNRMVYALYGHLNSTGDWQPGEPVERGQVLAGLGDVHENGGWWSPHVHFQLSTQQPPTHDLPGAVAPSQRAQALQQYFDPRYILGPLH